MSTNNTTDSRKHVCTIHGFSKLSQTINNDSSINAFDIYNRLTIDYLSFVAFGKHSMPLYKQFRLIKYARWQC